MGRKLSLQAFHLLPKIREVDAALRGDAPLRARTFEVHPEVSFAAMNGGHPLASPKRRSAGREERLALVRSLHPDPLALLPAGAVAKDDLLDAFAALWSAKRIAAGVARSLPNPIPHDAEGLPMAIWV
jgi:predicted RNase H-like nuclease